MIKRKSKKKGVGEEDYIFFHLNKKLLDYLLKLKIHIKLSIKDYLIS